MRRWRRIDPQRGLRRKIVLVLILLFLFVILLDVQLRPIMESITTNQARIKATDTINSTVAEELKNNGVSYSDLVAIERSDAGEVLAITTNVVKMNELRAVIIRDVQSKLGENSHQTVGVPFGTLTGNDLLHGYGPNVPLKVTLSGNVTADFKSAFDSAGINQTKHQIYLNIHTNVYSFIPWFNSTTEIDTNVLVAETVIVGQVPQVVANLK